MPLHPGTRLGPYEILGPLGAGGMGEVYRARDPRLGRDVAVKVLPEAFVSDPDRLRRFELEARATGQLSHPNIVAVFDVGRHDGVPYVVEELLEGETLRQKLAGGPLPPRKAIDYARQTAGGLAAAHHKGIVHRDLKPENLFLTHDGRVKILDFGLARVLQPEPADSAATGLPTHVFTQAGVVLGTVGYMSPEQVRGQPADPRSDIFSLGSILYEMLSGRRAFEAGSSVETMHAILKEDPPGIPRDAEDVPSGLERILRRCLEKSPDDRFQSARDLAVHLEASSEPTTALDAEPSRPRDRASIAVLPFDNLGNDPAQEYFADGIVEEIVTGLSRIKWLFVVSRSSAFIYKGKPVDVKTVGRELGVRYVLQGSVRRSGDQLRLTGQLVTTDTAVNVWADRFEGTLGDIFALQDQMTMSVISAVEPTLRRTEVERARRKRPGNLNAYDLFLHALPLAMTAMPADAERALGLLEEAIRLEPDYAAVHGLIAWCHEQRYLRAGLHAGTRDAALRHAHAAIETGTDDAMALAMGGFVVGVLARDYNTALDALDRSLALSPSSALAFGFSAIIRAWKGEDREAIEHGRMGIRLGPYDPLIYLPYVGLTFAYFFTGAFEDAASAAGRAAAANPKFSVPRYLHMAALVRLGRVEEARSMARLVLELQPGFTIGDLVSGNITSPERMTMLANALREAGLPE